MQPIVQRGGADAPRCNADIFRQVLAWRDRRQNLFKRSVLLAQERACTVKMQKSSIQCLRVQSSLASASPSGDFRRASRWLPKLWLAPLVLDARRVNKAPQNRSIQGLRVQSSLRVQPRDSASPLVESGGASRASPNALKRLPKLPLVLDARRVNEAELGRLMQLCGVSWCAFPRNGVEASVTKLRVALDHSTVVVAAYVKCSALSHDYMAAEQQPDQSGLDQTNLPAQADCRAGYSEQQRLVAFARAYSDSTLTASIHDLMVHPQLQGYGLGQRVLQRAIRELLQRGIEDIAVISPMSLLPFFQHCGFDMDRMDSTTMIYSLESPTASSSSGMRADEGAGSRALNEELVAGGEGAGSVVLRHRETTFGAYVGAHESALQGSSISEQRTVGATGSIGLRGEPLEVLAAPNDAELVGGWRPSHGCASANPSQSDESSLSSFSSYLGVPERGGGATDPSVEDSLASVKFPGSLCPPGGRAGSSAGSCAPKLASLASVTGSSELAETPELARAERLCCEASNGLLDGQSTTTRQCDAAGNDTSGGILMWGSKRLLIPPTRTTRSSLPLKTSLTRR